MGNRSIRRCPHKTSTGNEQVQVASKQASETSMVSKASMGNKASRSMGNHSRCPKEASTGNKQDQVASKQPSETSTGSKASRSTGSKASRSMGSKASRSMGNHSIWLAICRGRCPKETSTGNKASRSMGKHSIRLAIREPCKDNKAMRLARRPAIRD
jgi:hypothetical protein